MLQSRRETQIIFLTTGNSVKLSKIVVFLAKTAILKTKLRAEFYISKILLMTICFVSLHNSRMNQHEVTKNPEAVIIATVAK